jgi:hypothetical protein
MDQTAVDAKYLLPMFDDAVLVSSRIIYVSKKVGVRIVK